MRKYRDRRALTATEVADKLGVSTTSLVNWENGLTSPTLLKAFDWCQILNADLWPSLPGEA